MAKNRKLVKTLFLRLRTGRVGWPARWVAKSHLLRLSWACWVCCCQAQGVGTELQERQTPGSPLPTGAVPLVEARLSSSLGVTHPSGPGSHSPHRSKAPEVGAPRSRLKLLGGLWLRLSELRNSVHDLPHSASSPAVGSGALQEAHCCRVTPGAEQKDPRTLAPGALLPQPYFLLPSSLLLDDCPVNLWIFRPGGPWRSPDPERPISDGTWSPRMRAVTGSDSCRRLRAD